MVDAFTLKLHYGGTWKLLDDGVSVPVGFKHMFFHFEREYANLEFLTDLYTDYIECPDEDEIIYFDVFMHELQPVQVKRINTDLDVLNLFERASKDHVIDLYVASSAHEESTHEVLHQVASSDDNYHNCESSHSDDDYDVEDEEGEIMSTNLDSPDMSVGAKFENIDVFKLALSEYAVMNEFQVRYIKSEPKRVTVQCYEHDCKWRLHASRLRDGQTFQIRTLQEEHTCVSMNKNFNTMATQFWIAEKCTPWLRNEGDLSVKEIARRLNNTYHLQLPYQRIYRGKKLAFETMHGTWVDMYGRVPDLRRPPGRPKKVRQQYPTAPLPTQTSQDVSSSEALLSHTNVPSTQTSQVHSESVDDFNATENATGRGGRHDPRETRGRGRGRGLGSGRGRGRGQF